MVKCCSCRLASNTLFLFHYTFYIISAVVLCSSNLVDEKGRKLRRENGVVGRGSVGEKFQVSFLLFMLEWGVRGLVNHG